MMILHQNYDNGTILMQHIIILTIVTAFLITLNTHIVTLEKYSKKIEERIIEYIAESNCQTLEDYPIEKGSL